MLESTAVGRRQVRSWTRAGPVAVALVAMAAAVGFVGLRLAVAADGDVSRFVVAGRSFADPSVVEPRIHVFDSSGYDGQFYWRMAVAPDAHQLSPVQGMRLDQGIRLGRIGYPTAAWILAFGHEPFVVWSLVAVNVAGIGAIAGFAAMHARRHKHNPWYGLLVAGSSGLVMALSRDLTEVLMIAGIVGGIVAVDRRRPELAAVTWAFAALVHEQSLLIVGTYGLVRLVDLARSRRRPDRPDLAWIVPGLAYLAWQAVSVLRWDHLPATSSGAKNLDLPFVGLAGLVSDWLSGDVPRQELLFPIQLLLVGAIAVVAFRTPLAPEARWQRIAVASGALLAVLISYNVWKQPAELRQIAILPAVGWMTILSGPDAPARWLVGLAVVVTAATLALRIVAI